jgi:hypothetical protein
MPAIRTLHAALLAAAFAVASCGGGDSDASEPPVDSFTPVTSSDQIALPFDAYLLTAEQDQLNLKANNLLVRRCGERFGVEVTMPVGLNPTPNELNARRYGIIDGKRAQSYGYRPEQSPAEVDGPEWNPSEREMAVLGMSDDGSALRDSNGEPLPEGGCIAEADEALGGSEPPAPVDVVDVFKSAEGDSRIQAAWKRWSACMKDAGYDYASPWEPNNAKWPAEVTPKEIQTAVDDVECRSSTNLVGTWMAVEAAYQREAIEKDPEAFATMKDWHDNRVRAAADALKGS